MFVVKGSATRDCSARHLLFRADLRAICRRSRSISDAAVQRPSDSAGANARAAGRLAGLGRSGFLAAALSAASYFAVAGRSRAGLFLLSIISLAWLGFWRKGCVCPIGAIQNVTQSLFDSNYAAGGMVIAIFVLPLVFTLFFGRSFCASVCPFGRGAELVAVRPVQVPTWIDHALGLLAYVYLGAAVLFAATGSAWIICRYDPFVGLFRMISSANMLALSAGFLAVGLFIGRPYCRWLCPVRGDSGAAVAAVLAAPADSAGAVRAVPAVRGRLSLRRDPAADRRLPPARAHRRPDGG